MPPMGGPMGGMAGMQPMGMAASAPAPAPAPAPAAPDPFASLGGLK